MIRRLAAACLLALAWPAAAGFDPDAFSDGAFSSGAFTFGEDGPSLVEVPDCTSETTTGEACSSSVEGAGLVAVVVSRCSADVEVGDVISTNPAAGVEVAEGSAVAIRVASGPCGKGRLYREFGLDLRLGL